MSVNGISNFFQDISNQLFGETKDPAAATNAPETVNAGIAPIAEDIFTPSSQVELAQATAQDAGIFQIAQGTSPSSAANNLYAQTAVSGNADGGYAQASPAVNANAGAPADTAATTIAGNATNTGQGAAGAPSAQTAGSGAAAANEQLQIQELNAALPNLGLTNTEIHQIDRIASLVHNFNPAAYASLVNQFEALAQQNAASGAVNSAAIQGAATGTSANGSGFQVQQILVSFTGAQQPAAPGVQLGKVQFTFSNSSGQTVQVQTP